MGSIRRLLAFVLLIPAAFLLHPEASPRGPRSLDPKLLATLECSQNKPDWTVRKERDDAGETARDLARELNDAAALEILSGIPKN